MPPAAGTSPNQYELKSTKVQITYSTTSISGAPVFDFRQGRKALHFSGKEITTEKTAIATLVSVIVEQVPDEKQVTFSVVIPDVNLGDSGKVTLKTIGLFTTRRLSVGGPKPIKGALQSYKVTDLRGTAKAVAF